MKTRSNHSEYDDTSQSSLGLLLWLSLQSRQSPRVIDNDTNMGPVGGPGHHGHTDHRLLQMVQVYYQFLEGEGFCLLGVYGLSSLAWESMWFARTMAKELMQLTKQSAQTGVYPAREFVPCGSPLQFNIQFQFLCVTCFVGVT